MRPVALAALSIGLGLVLSIAFSWAMAYRHCYTTSSHDTLDSSDWIQSVPSDWPEKPDWTMITRTFGCTRFEAVASPPDWSLILTVTQSGWPLRSMYTKRFIAGRMYVNHGSIESFVSYTRERARSPTSYSNPGLGTESGLYLHDGPVQSMARNEVRLPLRLMPIGFIINWLAWSALVLLLMFGISTLMQLRRRQNGLCVRCGYPTTNLPSCPECGTPAPSKALT